MAEPKEFDFVVDLGQVCRAVHAENARELGEGIIYLLGLRDLPLPDARALARYIGEQMDTMHKEIEDRVRQRYENEVVRIKKDRSKREAMKQKIKAEFNGTNVAEIMERYGVCRATVYRIAGGG